LLVYGAKLPDGSVIGHAHLHGGADGPVVQVVPPSIARDFWCLNVKRMDDPSSTTDQRINFYVRNSGNGHTGFDQITLLSSIGQDCTNYPTPTGTWLSLKEGDYKPF
jgi:hypothetical protein